MSVSSRSHAELWPDVCDWFEARMELGGAEAAAEEVTEEAAEEPTVTEEAEAAEAEVEETEAAEAEVEEEVAAEEPAPESPELVDINGIGPAYADRLQDAGIPTVADLADADAGALAAETDISVERLEGWIEQAKELTG
jgi:polyhydroxyalkanoate synthase